MILRTVHRSRFAEPRESVSVFAYPQRRSFGACSGFQIDTCPIGTRRSSYCHTVTEVASGTKLRIKVSLRSTTKEPQAAWFREAGPTIRNPLQAAKQRSCGYERQPLPTTVPRSGTDISTMILRTVHRSRFAEPRESVSVFAYPQRRSFGACSGFQIDTCPIGTRRSSYCHTVTEYCRFNHLSCHANIVQRVKSCYKIKIDYRESKSCFYGVLLCKQHPCHRATFTLRKCHY